MRDQQHERAEKHGQAKLDEMQHKIAVLKLNQEKTKNESKTHSAY